MGVESGEWKVEWKMDKVESGKLVIEIIKAVVKCSLIASALRTRMAFKGLKREVWGLSMCETLFKLV